MSRLTSANLVEHAATALASFQIPKFDGVDPETVYEVFSPAFRHSRLDEDWMAYFKEKVSTISGGTVRVENASIEEFSSRIKGATAYLCVIRGEERMRFTFGPYGDPFEIG